MARVPKNPRYNCYFGCKEGGPLHHFPKPDNDSERFNVWKRVLERETQEKGNNYIYNQVRLCNKHFEHYFISPSKRLTLNAVPTLCLYVKDETVSCPQLDVKPLTSAELSSVSAPLVPEYTTITVKREFKTEHQHVRYNPLKDEWILVSPHRCKRPWSGQTEQAPEEQPPDPNNPLRAGAVRANGQKNPNYTSTYVFPNDFPALLEQVPEPPKPHHPLFQASQAKGTCRVMCFHPDSSMTIPLMSVEEITAVIEEWINQLQELGQRYTWVQIFENKGAVMGCSNPHPHCQIWASSYLPNEPRVKDSCQKEYYTKYGKSMLVDYVEQELLLNERIVVQNSEWVALVPYWAAWPYETMVLPINHRPQRMTDLNDSQKKSLAKIMKMLCTKYDNLFNCSFPYSMGWHGAPTGPSHKPGDSTHWLFHGIYLPPLLRSATVKKFMVGYEMLAQPQRDLTPEQAADKLRECDLIHYKNKK